MVTFVSLFPWLTIGHHPVEVAVEGPVATVEVLLDGRRVGLVTAPEWRVMCDFGSALRPHELEAVAFSATGEELAERTRSSTFLDPRPR